MVQQIEDPGLHRDEVPAPGERPEFCVQLEI
jgi:hypothetical protein